MSFRKYANELFLKKHPEINGKILKKLQDALSAEYLYTKKIDSYNWLILVNNLLAFSVPLIVLTSLYLTKGTPLEPSHNIISTISSLILLILTGFMFITGIPDKKEKFIVARRINRRTQKECRDNLYNNKDNLSYFLNHIHDIDDDDLDKLGKVSSEEKQASFRYALEKLDLGCEVYCPVCNKNPLTHADDSKSCQMCGLPSDQNPNDETSQKKVESDDNP